MAINLILCCTINYFSLSRLKTIHYIRNTSHAIIYREEVDAENPITDEQTVIITTALDRQVSKLHSENKNELADKISAISAAYKAGNIDQATSLRSELPVSNRLHYEVEL